LSLGFSCASGAGALPAPPPIDEDAFLKPGASSPDPEELNPTRNAETAAPVREERPAPPADPEPGSDAPTPATAAGAATDGTDGTDEVSPAESEALGRIAGQPLLAEDLLLEWNDISSRELWLVTERHVASRLALAEAQRLGIKLEPVEVETRVEAERRELRAEIVRRGIEVEEEEFIRRELRIEPRRYIARLRRATIHQLLAERAVRSFSLSTESVMARLIVVPEKIQMEEVQAALANGGDFAELARRYSVDDSAEEGGLVPFVVWQEHAPLARLAFRTEEGEIGGPLETADHHFLIKVERFRPALEGTWNELREPVEASLRDFPVSDGEFLSWKLMIENRYPVDLSGLIELLGTAR